MVCAVSKSTKVDVGMCCAPAERCGTAQDRAEGTVNNPKEKSVTNHTNHHIYPLHCGGGPIRQH